MAERRPSVTLVVPVHDDLATLDELHRRCRSALGLLDAAHRLLYVDDASTDGSWSWIVERAAADPAVSGVRLATNVGQTRAVCVGFEAARGADVIATIDSDLDFDPADLPRVIGPALAGADVSAAVRVERNDARFRRLAPSLAFNLALRVAGGHRLGDAGCGLFAVRAPVAARLPSEGHRRLAIRPLLGDLAETVVHVPVRYRSRPGHGISYRARAATAVEVLAVRPRSVAITGGAAAILATSALATRSIPRAVTASGAVLVAAGAVGLTVVERRRRADAAGSLAVVAEQVG